MATKNQTIDLEFTLSNNVKVKVDLSLANGHLLMKCREISGGMATIVYMMSEIATFDGEKIPAPEILNWNPFLIIELEEFWASLKKHSI